MGYDSYCISHKEAIENQFICEVRAAVNGFGYSFDQRYNRVLAAQKKYTDEKDPRKGLPDTIKEYVYDLENINNGKK